MSKDRFDQALAEIRGAEIKETAALVLRDKALQAVLACWPNVRRTIDYSAPPSLATLDDLWAAVKFDDRDLAELAGLPNGRALLEFRRAKGNRLIYPDGSLHQLAKVVLQKQLKDTLQGKAANK